MDGTTDATYTLGGVTDTWGRAWTDTELADGTFRLMVDKASDPDTYSKTRYTAPDEASNTIHHS